MLQKPHVLFLKYWKFSGIQKFIIFFKMNFLLSFIKEVMQKSTYTLLPENKRNIKINLIFF